MLWFWKHNKSTQPVVIDTENFNKLPQKDKKHFGAATLAMHAKKVTHEVVHHDDSGENFGLSMAVGMATDSMGLGYIAGGSLSGAMLGEMMAESVHHSDFGGGDGGGGGATGSWDSGSSIPDSAPSYDPGPVSTPDYSPSSDSTSSYDSSSSSSFDSGSSSSFDSSSSGGFDSGSSF